MFSTSTRSRQTFCNLLTVSLANGKTLKKSKRNKTISKGNRRYQHRLCSNMRIIMSRKLPRLSKEAKISTSQKELRLSWATNRTACSRHDLYVTHLWMKTSGSIKQYITQQYRADKMMSTNCCSEKSRTILSYSLKSLCHSRTQPCRFLTLVSILSQVSKVSLFYSRGYVMRLSDKSQGTRRILKITTPVHCTKTLFLTQSAST